MFSGVPNGPLRLSPPQVHAAVHNSGESVLRLEQMEALDGVASEVMDALAALKESTEQGLERLRFATDLVRHLTTHSRGTSAKLPVC